MKFSKLFCFPIFLALSVLAAAQAAGVAALHAPVVNARAHASATAVFQIAVQPGFHIQSNRPSQEFLIPTSLKIDAAHGVSVTRIDWPATQNQKFSFSAKPLAVFAGDLKVPVELKTGAPGHYRLRGTFRYQACNDQLCRPPVTTLFLLDVNVR